MFSVSTWNINGIRANRNYDKELEKENNSIFCFQETKITREMLNESIALVDGFSSYFSFSRKRTGYSGVATFCRSSCTPVRAEEGLSGCMNSNQDRVEKYTDLLAFTDEELKELDSEGRCVITEHEVLIPDGSTKVVVVFNLYIPRVDPDKPERHVFKLRFLQLLQLRAEAVLKSGKFVILAGDFNISHRRIDHCEGESTPDFEDNTHRQWLDNLLNQEKTDKSDENSPSNFVDLFRKFHPDRTRAYTCWNTYINARVNNYGTRIDYIVCDSEFAKFCEYCDIKPDVMGSDHCPVIARFCVKPVPAKKIPSACTKFYKEFSGKQQKLSNFVIRTGKLKERENEEHSEKEQTCGVKQEPRGVKRTASGQQTLLGFFSKKAEKEKDAAKLSQCSNEETDVVVKCSESYIERSGSLVSSQVEVAAAWKKMLKGPPKPPNCKGHSEPCILRTVKKKGPNSGKQFWVCNRGEGHAGDPAARCDFFQWV